MRSPESPRATIRQAVRVVDGEDQAKDPPFRRIDLSLVVELNLADNLAGTRSRSRPTLWLPVPAAAVRDRPQQPRDHRLSRDRAGSALCILGDACDMSSPSIYHGGGIQAEARLHEGKSFDLFVGGGPVITGFDRFGIGS